MAVGTLAEAQSSPHSCLSPGVFILLLKIFWLGLVKMMMVLADWTITQYVQAAAKPIPMF